MITLENLKEIAEKEREDLERFADYKDSEYKSYYNNEAIERALQCQETCTEPSPIYDFQVIDQNVIEWGVALVDKRTIKKEYLNLIKEKT